MWNVCIPLGHFHVFHMLESSKAGTGLGLSDLWPLGDERSKSTSQTGPNILMGYLVGNIQRNAALGSQNPGWDLQTAGPDGRDSTVTHTSTTSSHTHMRGRTCTHTHTHTHAYASSWLLPWPSQLSLPPLHLHHWLPISNPYKHSCGVALPVLASLSGRCFHRRQNLDIFQTRG